MQHHEKAHRLELFGRQPIQGAFLRKAVLKRHTNANFRSQKIRKALRAELYARIEGAHGPIGPLNRFQMEEMIDPRDTRRYICDWVKDAYRIVTHPGILGPRALQFRP